MKFKPRKPIVKPDYPVKTIPEKFVYHLSYKHYREPILLGPLGCRSSVYAHNTDQISLSWYKLCLDMYFFNYCDKTHLDTLYTERERLRYGVNRHYDIWRIDTAKANKDWYIDYTGLGDCHEEVKENYFIYSKGTISLDAVTLCTLDDYNVGTRELYNNSVITTYSPKIIPRSEYIMKYGFEPEVEIENTWGKHDILDLTLNDEKVYLNNWKQLKNKKISLLNAA